MSTTRIRVTKLSLAWLALTLALLSAACTKKSSPPPQAGAVPPTATVNTNAPQPSVKKIPGAPGIPGKDVGTSTSSQEGESIEGDEGSLRLPPPPDSGMTEVPTDELPPQGKPLPPDNSPAEGEIVTDPTGLTPDQIFAASEQLGQAEVGLPADVVGEPKLYYSGSGQDYLREQLSTIAGDASEEDRKFAERLGLSTFDVDWKTRSAKALVSIVKKNGKRETINFKGKLENSAKLTAGSLSKKPGVLLEATCMDADGGCTTVHMKLQRKTKNDVLQTAHVIARKTSAHIYTDGNPPGVSQNREYDYLMSMFINTARSPGSPESVRSLEYVTSETINGRSEFAVLMKMGSTSHRLALTGPLVKPKSSNDLNLVLDPPGETKNSLGEIIREMRLIRNDGRGNLQFDIVVRKNSERSSEDTIRLMVARKHPEGVRSPSVK
jgi:hypothetical protein